LRKLLKEEKYFRPHLLFCANLI